LQKKKKFSNRPGLVLGFHGTDETVVRDVVLRQRNLLASNNDWDWIGHGIYFWEYSPSRALEYAIAASRRRGSVIKTPAVVGAVIDLGHCLDLLDYEKLLVVKQNYEDIKHRLGPNLPENLPSQADSQELHLRFLDCAVIQAVHDTNAAGRLPSYDSVKAVFWEGTLLYPNAGFREKNHIQICVRNPACIKGFFIP